MGRPYAAELSELGATYEWSVRAPISELASSVSLSADGPLIAVGSGGSLTSAHFASLLHTRFTGHASQILTPYELITSSQRLLSATVLICSAGGSNPDVIAASEFAVKRTPKHVFALTTRPGSVLEKRLGAASWPSCHAFPTPTRKDGFLATNSLLATLVLLTRAYESLAGAAACLPSTLDSLMHPDLSWAAFIEQHREHFASVVDRETLVVLHGSTTKPAAIDVESRFTEAALANVQTADFRNFAHGRHHWLARHEYTSAVLAFAEEGDQIARRTLSLLPVSIPQCLVSVEAGLRGGIAAICQSIVLAGVAGIARGIDPGRPCVPRWGRKLYHLRAARECCKQG